MWLKTGRMSLKTSSSVVISVFRRPSGRALWKTSFLPKSFEKIADQGVEFAVVFSLIFDLSNRVNDRRVMFAAKTAPDFGQRGVGQRLTQIHRNLTRLRHRLRVIARFQI